MEFLFGYVTNLEANGRVRVKFPSRNNLVSQPIPVLKSRSKKDKEGNILDIDEEVACIMDDNCEDGLCLGAYNTDESPLIITDKDKKYYTFSDGTHFEYDRKNHIFTGDIKGYASITAETTYVKGKLIVDGDIISTGDIFDKNGSMQEMRDTYNPHTHNCPDGTTSAPSGAMQ